MEEAPKQPKSKFKSVDLTLKSETWILKNSGLKLLYYHILKLDQSSLKFKFMTSKLDQQTWILTLVAWELLPFCPFSLILLVELQQLIVKLTDSPQIREHLFSFIFLIFPSPYSTFNIKKFMWYCEKTIG